MRIAPIYVHGLGEVLSRAGRLFLLCFSERTPREPWDRGGSRRNGLREAFRDGWEIDSIPGRGLRLAPIGGKCSAAQTRTRGSSLHRVRKSAREKNTAAAHGLEPIELVDESMPR